jgi:formate dehydrogenase maturation protein FdhE
MEILRRQAEADARLASREDLLWGGLRLEWTFSAVRFQISRMGQSDQIRLCPQCGSPMVLAPTPEGEGPRKLQCFECARPDPLKSDAIQWLKGQLQPPK